MPNPRMGRNRFRICNETSPEEWLMRLLEWAEGHSPEIPVLANEHMTRESIYGD